MNVGLDIGYSGTKAIAGQRRATFPSVVGTPEKAQFSLNGAHDNDIILIEPVHVLIGEGAIVQSRYLSRREDRAWVQSDEWYALALAAFSELTAATVVELQIVTGLPVAFYGDRKVVRDRLLGEHRLQREDRRAQTLRVTGCRVIPQPFGALLAAALDDQGRVVDVDLAAGNVGVIDVGGKTTNLLSVNRLAEVGRETASVSVGAWTAARAVGAYLNKRCPDLELRDHKLMEAVLDRQVKYYGESVDLSKAVEETLGTMADQVIAQATQLWNGGAGLDVVLVTGGGALLLGPAIRERFRHARVVEEPVFANALGYWRLAQRVQ